MGVSLRSGVLAILAQGPSHGYKLKSQIEDLLLSNRKLNVGHIYLTLHRLERQGLIKTLGGRGNRGKRVYRLTRDGEAAAEAWLTTPEGDAGDLPGEVYIKLLLSAQLGDGRLTHLVTLQRRAYRERLQELANVERRAQQQRRLDLLLLVRGTITRTEADLRLVEAYAMAMHDPVARPAQRVASSATPA